MLQPFAAGVCPHRHDFVLQQLQILFDLGLCRIDHGQRALPVMERREGDALKLAARRRLKRLGTVGKRPQGEVAQDGGGQNGEKEEYTHDGDIYTNSPVTGMEKRPVGKCHSSRAALFRQCREWRRISR